MLPALPKGQKSAVPRNLTLPDRRTYYPMPAVPNGGRPVDNVRRGSMAGRAVLTYIKGAPAQRQGRR